MPGSDGFEIERIGEVATNLVLTWGLRVIGALAVLFIGKIVAGMVRTGVRKGLEKAKMDATLVPFLSNLTYYMVMAFVFIAVLGLFGIPTASLIAVMGAAGLAVGLALQGTLSNFGAGVMLLVFRPFRVGDFVDVGGTVGSVKEIGIFTTTLDTPDNVQITVPNSAVFGQTMKNYSANDNRRVDMVMGIGYGDDIGKAVQVIKSIMEADGRVLKDPAAVVAVGELADSSVNILVRPWCRKEDYWDVLWDLTRRFKEQLEGAGCNIPYPQRDLHVYQHGPDSAA